MQKNYFQIHNKDFYLFRHHTNEIGVFTKEIMKQLNGKTISTFLDIGAGSGELTKALNAKLNIKKIVAIDKEIPVKKINHDIVFLKNDWVNFAYPERFDLILSCHSIAYLPSKQIKKAIEKIYNYLKPKGIAIIIIYNNSDKTVWSLFKKIFYPKGDVSTSSHIEPIINNYPAKEKCFLTKVYSDNLEQMFQIGKFLAEKHLPLYLNKESEVKEFFKKYQNQNKKIILPLEHKMFIIYKK